MQLYVKFLTIHCALLCTCLTPWLTADEMVARAGPLKWPSKVATEFETLFPAVSPEVEMSPEPADGECCWHCNVMFV